MEFTKALIFYGFVFENIPIFRCVKNAPVSILSLNSALFIYVSTEVPTWLTLDCRAKQCKI